MKKIKQIITVLASSTLILSALGGCSKNLQEDSLSYASMKERGYLIMGLDDTFAPMGFRDNAGNIVGFDVDLANEVGKRLGIEIKFQPIDWSMKETELNAGNIDLIWNGYTITEKRKEVVNFSTPYLENSQIIITLADSTITSKSDLQGKMVSLQKESSALDAVMAEPELASTFAEGGPIQFSTNNEAFIDLEAGRSQAVVADEVLARYYMKLKGEDKYKVLDDNYGNEEYGIGIRKSNEDLLADINQALADMNADGTYKSIYETWFAQS